MSPKTMHHCNLFHVDGMVVRVGRPYEKCNHSFRNVMLSISTSDGISHVVPFCFRDDVADVSVLVPGDFIRTSFLLAGTGGNGSSSRNYARIRAGRFYVIRRADADRVEREREEMRKAADVAEMLREINVGRK